MTALLPKRAGLTDARLGALVGALLACLMLAGGWGYTVDDSLISARVSANLALGHGYRFNPHGDVVDAVTPLGYAHLLSWFGGETPLAALATARVLGAAAWFITMVGLGAEIARRHGRLALGWLAVFALNPCAGAWATSGMETPLVALLVGLGARVFAAPRAARWLCLGVASALRPELLAASLVLWVWHASEQAGLRRVLPFAVGLLPTALVIAARLAWFGSAAPLSVLAKPSDLDHGFRYAIGGWLLSGAPVLLLAPLGWRRASARARFLGAAVLAHAASLTLAGGDWMALYRLFVPVLPVAVLAAAELGAVTGRRSNLVRGGAALLAAGLLWWHSGFAARHVLGHRLALIADARPHLEGKRVAALDVGWVGAAGAAEITDLAGVTDPTIAVLPGGHTSKRVDPNLLKRRQVEVVVLQWDGAAPLRDVERRILNEIKELGVKSQVELEVRAHGWRRPVTYRIIHLRNEL